MRALITGGAGFVGHAIVRALVAAQVEVVVLDPAPPHPRWPSPSSSSPPALHHVRASLLDDTALRRAAAGCDVVFHVAGLWDSRPDGAARMYTLNVEGTRAVLALGRPTVYTSSSITCGFGPRTAPGTEDDPSEDPHTPLQGVGRVYRATKQIAERLVCAAGGWIVNPDYVLGPGDPHSGVTAPLLLAARLPLLPAPRGGKCFVGVEDVGLGHLLVWQRGTPARRYLLGAENLSYAEILSLIARAAGRPAPRLLPLPAVTGTLLRQVPALASLAGALEQMHLSRYRSAARAQRELGWQPAPISLAIDQMLHPLPRDP